MSGCLCIELQNFVTHNFEISYWITQNLPQNFVKTFLFCVMTRYTTSHTNLYLLHHTEKQLINLKTKYLRFRGYVGKLALLVIDALLILQLKSRSSEERECGCGTIANFVSQAGVIPQLLRINIIKIMGPLMMDPSQNVRCAAVGAFRSVLLQSRNNYLLGTGKSYGPTAQHIARLHNLLFTAEQYK